MNSREILDKWHNDWKNSSLFQCFDGCEHHVARWWLLLLGQACREEYDKAFTAGFEAAKKKAIEVVDYDGSAACAYCERINELISNMKED